MHIELFQITSKTGSTEIGELIASAMEKVGRKGVITMEESRGVEDNLYVVEGMQVSSL